jgi:TonB family protein
VEAVHANAAQSLLATKPSRLGGFLIFSVVLHASLVGAGMVANLFLAGPRIDLDQKPITASLVRQGKKREEELLPRKEPEPPPPPPDTAIPIPTPNAPPPPPKLKQHSDKPAPDKRKSLFDAFNKTAKPDDAEGEENADPNGTAAKQEGERYFGVISSAVHRYYDVSNTIPESERIRLHADVRLRLNAEGGLIDVDVKSSGNDTFDSAVLGAVKKAAPFGPPPAHLRASLQKEGVTLRFTP